MAEQKQDDQLEHTYNSYVRIRDVALKTCQRRWTIGKSGERRSGISVLATRHDDDDDDDALLEICSYQVSFEFQKNLFLNKSKCRLIKQFALGLKIICWLQSANHDKFTEKLAVQMQKKV